MINLILYPISIIPVILIYLWIVKKVLMDEEHQKLGKKALFSGFMVVVPAFIFGALLRFLSRKVLGLDEDASVFASLLYAFITIAMTEELSKGFMMQRLVKKHKVGYSWLDIISYMVIVAIGFDIIESAVYAITTTPAMILVRGVTIPHVAYGFIMGYFSGKAMKTGNKMFYMPAVLIPWVLHGAYDFSLSSVLAEDELAAVGAVMLAAFELIVAIITIVFMNKARKKEKFTEIIRQAE